MRASRYRFASLIVCVLAGLVGTVPAQLASAQPSVDELGIPSEFLNDSQLRPGDQIAFCIDPTSSLAAFEQEVATAIADRLLMRPVFAELPSQDDIYGQFFLESIYIALVNSCDVSMGMALAPSGYPDWLTVTRAYVSFDYVLVVADPGYARLADVPKSRLIGTQVTSLGEYSFAVYNSLLPSAQRWRHIPYADMNLMLTRVQDGTIGGAIIFAPTLQQLLDNGAGQDLRTLPLTPVPNVSASLAGILLSNEVFLRTQIDMAIQSLIDDGSIAALLQQHGLPGRAGGV